MLITETFASGVVGEGIFQTLEHAHANLLTPDAVVIPQAASVMGYLAGGGRLAGLLFVDRVAGFDLSAFNDFAPSRLPVSFNGVPHHAMSLDTEFARFDFRQRQFPMVNTPLAVEATCRALRRRAAMASSRTGFRNALRKPSSRGRGILRTLDPYAASFSRN